MFIAFRLGHHYWSRRAHSLSTQKRKESYDESCSDTEESWSDEESAEAEVDTQENRSNEKDSVVRAISTLTKIDED